MNKEKFLDYIKDHYKTTGNYCEVYLPINSEWLIKAVENGEFD